MYCRLVKNVCLTLVVFAATGIASQATAGFVGSTLDSSGFTYKYEMDVMPSGQDLDGNSVMDLDAHESASGHLSVSGGVLTVIGSDGGSDYFGSESAGKIWQTNFATPDYTVEFSAKVLSSSGTEGALGFFAADAYRAGIKLFDTQTTSAMMDPLSTASNTDAFHTFRFSMKGSKYYAWRDGVLVGDGLDVIGTTPSMYFGDGGGNINGTTQLDYVRLTTGAYAPIPEPSAFVLTAIGLVGLLAYVWRRRK